MQEIIKTLETELNQIIHQFKETLLGLRGGRPTAKLVEDIHIEYFGQMLPIKQVGSINIVPPREIQISAWDKSAISAIVKAIDSANLNVGVSGEANMVRVTLPQLSAERREELVRLVKKEAEEARIKIRTVRDDANKEGKRKEETGEITEDEKFRLKDEIQKLVDKANADIEISVEGKSKEIEE